MLQGVSGESKHPLQESLAWLSVAGECGTWQGQKGQALGSPKSGHPGAELLLFLEPTAEPAATNLVFHARFTALYGHGRKQERAGPVPGSLPTALHRAGPVTSEETTSGWASHGMDELQGPSSPNHSEILS